MEKIAFVTSLYFKYNFLSHTLGKFKYQIEFITSINEDTIEKFNNVTVVISNRLSNFLTEGLVKYWNTIVENAGEIVIVYPSSFQKGFSSNFDDKKIRIFCGDMEDLIFVKGLVRDFVSAPAPVKFNLSDDKSSAVKPFSKIEDSSGTHKSSSVISVPAPLTFKMLKKNLPPSTSGPEKTEQLAGISRDYYPQYLKSQKILFSDEVVPPKTLPSQPSYYPKIVLKCPVCQNKFVSPHVKEILISDLFRLSSERSDSNPLLYEALICTTCFFSSYLSGFENPDLKLTQELLAGTLNKISSLKDEYLKLSPGYKKSIKAFQLMMKCYSGYASPAFLAVIALKIALLFRLDGNSLKEKEFLKESQAFLLKEYQVNGFKKSEYGEIPLIYLLARINYISGKFKDALNFYNQIIFDDAAVNHPQILEISRNEKLQAARYIHNADQSE